MKANCSVYQIKKSSNNYLNKCFASLRILNKLGLEFDINDYECIWNSDEIFDTDNENTICEKLYTRFNIGEKPENYKGHSLSLSDLVMINNNLYYCDSFGFKLMRI